MKNKDSIKLQKIYEGAFDILKQAKATKDAKQDPINTLFLVKKEPYMTKKAKSFTVKAPSLVACLEHDNVFGARPTEEEMDGQIMSDEDFIELCGDMNGDGQQYITIYVDGKPVFGADGDDGDVWS
jgi:hypothetical protein